MGISKKKGRWYFSQLRGAVGWKKVKKKKKKRFLWDFVPFGFPISGDKKGEKSKWFCFFP